MYEEREPKTQWGKDQKKDGDKSTKKKVKGNYRVGRYEF